MTMSSILREYKKGKRKCYVVPCYICGNEAHVRSDMYKGRHFCGHKCYAEYKRKDRVTRKCIVCGKAFEVREQELKNRPRKTCSNEKARYGLFFFP